MAETKACLFCSKAATVESHLSNWEVWSCPQCGGFEVNADDYDSTEHQLPTKPPINEENKHLIAGYLFRRSNRKGKIRLISDEATLNDPTVKVETVRITQIISETPKTTIQRLESLLRYAYLIDNTIGHEFNIPTPAAGYAKSRNELDSMIVACKELGWFQRADTVSFIISTKGLRYAEELLSTNSNSKKAFVAMGFREDLLAACEQAIKPACTACGFDAFLITDTEHNNGITDEIIAAIKQSRFVVVDFTYGNQGAYWEAGYAQGLGREVFRCIKKGWFDEDNTRLHFDIRHYNTILWKDHDDLFRKLKARIRATIEGAKFED